MKTGTWNGDLSLLPNQRSAACPATWASEHTSISHSTWALMNNAPQKTRSSLFSGHSANAMLLRTSGLLLQVVALCSVSLAFCSVFFRVAFMPFPCVRDQVCRVDLSAASDVRHQVSPPSWLTCAPRTLSFLSALAVTLQDVSTSDFCVLGRNLCVISHKGLLWPHLLTWLRCSQCNTSLSLCVLV